MKRIDEIYNKWMLHGPLIRSTLITKEAANLAISAYDDIQYLINRVRKLEKALERIGSMKAFLMAHRLDDNLEAQELIARIDFAREALEGDE